MNSEARERCLCMLPGNQSCRPFLIVVRVASELIKDHALGCRELCE
jgi:hypothetical protein